MYVSNKVVKIQSKKGFSENNNRQEDGRKVQKLARGKARKTKQFNITQCL